MLHKITFIEVIDSKLISEDKLLKYCKDIYHLNQKTGSPTFESEPKSIDEIRGFCTEHFNVRGNCLIMSRLFARHVCLQFRVRSMQF